MTDKKKLLTEALSEGSHAKRMMESIEKYEKKLQDSKEALERTDGPYIDMLKEDIRLYESSLKHFRHSRDGAIEHFLNYVDQFKDKI